MKKVFIVFILMVLTMCLYAFINHTGLVSIAIRNNSLSMAEWEEDINQFQEEMINRNLALKNSKNKDIWDKEINSYFGKAEQNRSLPSIFILKQVAGITDSHTQVINYPDGHEVVYPLVIEKFIDGFFITNVTEENREMLGKKVISLNETPIEDVYNKMGTYIPVEANNSSRYMDKFKDYVSVRDILLDMEILHSKSAPIILKAGDKRYQIQQALKKDVKFIKENPEKNLRNEITLIEDTLYIRCDFCKRQPFSKLDLEKIKQKNVNKIIIDLRENAGGYYHPENIFEKAIKGQLDRNNPPKLIVLTGRRTFSSAVLYAVAFKRMGAIVIGESPGTPPNHYGNVRVLKLKNSKLAISYPTKYFVSEGYAKESVLVPDILVEMRGADCFQSSDPTMEVALKT